MKLSSNQVALAGSPGATDELNSQAESFLVMGTVEEKLLESGTEESTGEGTVEGNLT